MIVRNLILALVSIIVIAVILVPICEVNEKEPLAVVVVAGQSNAQYRTANVDLNEMNAQGLPTHDVLYYGDSKPVNYATPDNIIYDTSFNSYGVHSMLNSSKTAWRIGSEDAQIALKLSNKLNCDVLVINVGIGNANIQYLQPSQTGGIFVKNVIDNALNEVENNYRIEKVGYVWIQGESDKTTPVDTYISRFNSIYNWYESIGFDKCYMVITKPSDSGNANTAQLQLCEDNPNVIKSSTSPSTFTTDNGLLASDNLHYTQAGRIIIADDVVDHIDINVSGSFPIMVLIPILAIVAVILYVANMSYVKDKDL